MPAPQAIVIEPDFAERFHRKAAAETAIGEYIRDPRRPGHLEAATAAVARFRRRFGPLEYRGFLWTIDGAGELLRLPAKKRRDR
jgi:hypothetical protein